MMKALLLLALVASCVLTLEVNHDQALPNGTRPNSNNNNFNQHPNNNNNFNPYQNNQQQQLQPSPCFSGNTNGLIPLVRGQPWQYSGPFKITCNLKINPNVLYKYSLCYNANDCRTCILDYGHCQGTVQVFGIRY